MHRPSRDKVFPATGTHCSQKTRHIVDYVFGVWVFEVGKEEAVEEQGTRGQRPRPRDEDS